MAKKEYNPFQNVLTIDRRARGAAAQSGHHISTGVSAPSSAPSSIRKKTSKSPSKDGLSAATPSSSKRLRGGGRY